MPATTTTHTKQSKATAPKATPIVSKQLQLWRKLWFPTTLLAIFFFLFFKKDICVQLHYGGSAATKDGTPVLVSYSGSHTTSDSEEALNRTFIQRFAKVALGEQKKIGVPAAIVLAASLLHAQFGTPNLAATANNFFELPCTEDWHGATFSYQGNCYRRYLTAWESFRDHSLYLTSGNFATLKSLKINNLEEWASALERCGYSKKTPKLAAQLMGLIEKYELNKL